MKKLIKKITLIAVILIALLATLAVSWWYFYGSKIEVEIKNLTLSLKEKKAFLLVELELQKIAPFDMEATIDYNALWQHEQIAIGKVVVKMTEEVVVQIPMIIELTKLQEMQKQDNEIVINGTIKANIPISFPLNFSLVREIKAKPKTEYKILALNIEAVSQQKVNLSAKLLLNPAPRIENLQVDYTVKMDDTKIAQGKLQSKAVEKNNTAILDIPITLNADVIKAKKAENIGKNVEVAIQGTIKGKREEQEISIPFHVKKIIKLQGQAFSVTDKTIMLKNISTEELDCVIKLDIESKHNKEIKNLFIDYVVYAENIKILDGKIKSPLITSSEQSKIDVPIHLKRKIWNDIREKYKGKQIKMNIKGNILAKISENNFSIPFHVNKEIPVRERPFSVKFKKIRVKKFRLRGSIYNITLEVTSLLPSKIENLQLEGNIEIVKGLNINIQEELTLIPNKPESLTIEASVKRGGFARLIAKAIRNKFSNGRFQLKFRGKDENGTVFSSETNEEQTISIEESE